MNEKPKVYITEQLHRAIHAGLLPEVKKLIQDGAEMDRVLGIYVLQPCATKLLLTL